MSARLVYGYAPLYGGLDAQFLGSRIHDDPEAAIAQGKRHSHYLGVAKISVVVMERALVLSSAKSGDWKHFDAKFWGLA
jgi:hypothetical protein